MVCKISENRSMYTISKTQKCWEQKMKSDNCIKLNISSFVEQNLSWTSEFINGWLISGIMHDSLASSKLINSDSETTN